MCMGSRRIKTEASTATTGSMEYLSGQSLAVISYIDPVVAVLLSALVLRESMGLTGAIGAVMILGAALVSEMPERKK